jgi:S-DNA-T family DNA segregation ATPase FtsK/SpoIIIE
VIIDEFAALAAEVPGFVPALVGISQRGRSLGIHLVLATQRPSGVVDDAIRANTNLRLALRLQDPADGRDVVGDAAPASFPRGTPGRAMLCLGPDEAVVFQTACSGAAARGSELDVLVRAIRHAAALSDIAPPHRPWLPPLPARLGPGDCDGVALGPGDAGVLDDPSAQRRSALRWAPADGHLALLGPVGSGTTTTLITLVAALVQAHPPSRVHVYVVDATGDHRLDRLDRIPHCGGVVRPHERERLTRLLRRVVDDLDDRRRAGGRGERPYVVLAVDGVAALRGSLHGDVEELELLARIVGEGPALGVACVLIADRPGAVPPAMLAACGDRWVFRLDDPAEATLCGVPAAAVPRRGPGRIVVASSRLDGQVALIEPPDGGGRNGGPAPVGTLPAGVGASGLPPGHRGADGETELVIGIEFHSLAPATLVVPDGEHVLVAGPPRSGRSTAMLQLARSWREAHPDGLVHAATTPESIVATVQAAGPDRPCLVLVDDADRVDDDTGALARLVTARRPGLLVVAAGRPAALRAQYGQWTNVVRRSRLGLLMAACVDTDGDVLGELLPRRPPLPPRPGLAWIVGTGPRVLVQVGLS